jgi:nucleoside-diphosphate-sugar epimerase
MSRVLVTGASGFIGQHLVEILVARGDVVTCLVRKTSNTGPLQKLGVALACGDVTDRESLKTVVEGKDAVYHLAGLVKSLDPADMFRVNEGGTRNLVETCADLPCPPVVLLVSSLAAAGPSAFDHLREESEPLTQVSDYGRSKRAAEMAALSVADRVPISVVRPPIVLGEADTQGLTLFRTIARFGVHLVPGLAPRRFSVIHATDLASLFVAVVEKGERLLPADSTDGRKDAQGFYFVADHEHPTYADLGRMIGQAVGRRRVRVRFAPMPFVWTVSATVELISKIKGRPLYLNLDKAREVAAGSWTCSPHKANATLGFSPVAPFSERLCQTATWYRQHGWI